MNAPATPLLSRLLPAGEAQAAPRRWLRDHGMPTSRDEAWRYTALDEIAAVAWEPPEATTGGPHLDVGVVDELVGRHGGSRLVLVDGVVDPRLSDLGSVPADVVLDVEGRLDDPGRPAPTRYDGFVALNEVVAPATATVRVAPGVNCAAPVHIVHLSVPGERARVSHPRTAVHVAAGARVSVIESYVATPGASLTNAVTVIEVGSGAELDHHRLVGGAGRAMHVGHTAIVQQERSNVRSWSLVRGVDVARHHVDVRLVGEGAEVDLQGLQVPTGTQRHDTSVVVEHARSHGTSRQHFRGVVDGHARSSFSGRVIVARDTAGNDARQTNRNLLLCPTAQADARPWLEIFADDVRCTHGATVGRLDDEALFYLRSRGIPSEHARAMLVHGFASELTAGVEPASLRSLADDAVAAAVGGGPTDAGR